VNQDVGNAHIYTTISAGDEGTVDMAWYSATTSDPSRTDNDWHVDFAQVRNANTGLLAGTAHAGLFATTLQ